VSVQNIDVAPFHVLSSFVCVWFFFFSFLKTQRSSVSTREVKLGSYTLSAFGKATPPAPLRLSVASQLQKLVAGVDSTAPGAAASSEARLEPPRPSLLPLQSPASKASKATPPSTSSGAPLTTGLLGRPKEPGNPFRIVVGRPRSVSCFCCSKNDHPVAFGLTLRLPLIDHKETSPPFSLGGILSGQSDSPWSQLSRRRSRPATVM
jgi:hypothetical protein